MIRFFIRLFSIVLAISILCCPTWASAGKMKITVGDETVEVSTIDQAGLKYFSFSELAESMGGTLDWEIIGHKISYADNDHKMNFLIGSSYFTRDSATSNMTYPAVYQSGQLFLPAVTYFDLIDDVAPVRTQPAASPTKRPKIRTSAYNVADVAISPKANGLLIEVLLTGPVSYDAFLSEGNWINISVRDGRVNSPLIESRVDKRYMYDLKCHQVGATGQVSFWMRRPITGWEHHLAKNPDRIQISIADSAFNADSSSTPTTIGPGKKVNVIVVDAGHGGNDYGAIGYNGAREKDVTLAIARQVAAELKRDSQLKVVMTRTEDKTVSLEQRADIANKAGADLFISIHANANPKQNVRGWNIFFLAPAKNDSARAAEQLENSYFIRENSAFKAHLQRDEDDGNAVTGILNDMLMTEFQSESHDLALMIDREFRKSMSHPARGVDQAGFFVLNKIFTPSVLIETAFITNPTEEKLLRDKSFQRQMAESIADAVKRFRAKYEKREKG